MKKLVNCKACGKEVAKGVKRCPHCGKDNRNFFKKHKILTVIISLLLLGVAVGGGASGGSDVGEKYEVKITNAYNDEFALYIEGTVTNNSGRDLTYVQILIPTYDADGNKVGDAMDNINNLKDGETWKFKAMDLSGGVNYDAENYELDAF
mgnify:CR=1 FL=1